MTQHDLQADIVATAKAMDLAGFAPTKSGNVSARTSNGFLITPSGLPYAQMGVADIVEMRVDGTVLTVAQDRHIRPSTEWPFHAAIYVARPEVQAIVHSHSPFATALSATRQGLPAFHYMIAMAGGPDIRCADYATFGTEELARNAVMALQERKAALLANHGVIALGGSLKGAWSIAFEVENLARQYLAILASGLKPVILDHDEMKRVIEKFAGYGKVG